MATKTTKKSASEIKAEIIGRVTESLLEKMANPGTWKKAWKTTGTGSLPMNAVSKKGYRGINVPILFFSGFSSPWWATYKQWAEKGGQVRKGETGTEIVFWKKTTYKDKNDLDANGKPKEKSSLLLRTYKVFNADQVDGIEGKLPEKAKVVLADHEPIDAAELVVKTWGSLVKINETKQDRAYYNTRLDQITVPVRGQFGDVAEFYSTTFHEMVHSTGHSSRLDRFGEDNTPSPFGSPVYAEEELVAEFGAAFLCALTGIENGSAFDNNAAYLASWRKKCKDAPDLLVTAAQKAQKAIDLILSKVEDLEIPEPKTPLIPGWKPMPVKPRETMDRVA